MVRQARLTPVLLTALCLWSTAAHTEPAPRHWNLILDGGIAGRFVQPSCRDTPQTNAQTFSRRIAFGDTQRTQAASSGDWAPLSLNTGDLIAPNAVSRYLLHEATRGHTQLTSLLQLYRYDSIGVGNHEFHAKALAMRPFWEHARTQRTPFNAGNLTCNNSKDALCTLLHTATSTSPPYRVVRRGGARVAILGLSDPDLQPIIAKSYREGVSFGSMSKTLAHWLPHMRKDADLVVVHAHVASDTSRRALEIDISSMKGVDILVTNALRPLPRASDQQIYGYRILPQSGTLSLLSGFDEKESVLASLRVTRDPARGWRVHPIQVVSHKFSQGNGEPGAQRDIQALHQQYCKDWGTPIGAAMKLTRPWDRKRFEREVLELMRQSTHTEVSLMNKGAFRGASRFPLSGHLTRSDLYSVMPFSTQVVVANILGKDLANIAKKLSGGELLTLGLTRTKKHIKVNGRLLDKKRVYRVAMNRFLAQEGDDILKESWLRQVHVEPMLLDEMLTQHWKTKGPAKPNNLHERFLWSARGEVNASYKQVDVSNPIRTGAPAYNQSQLTVNPTSQVNLDGKIALSGNQRAHIVDAQIMGQYATAFVEDDDASNPQGFQETADRAQLKTSYTYSWRQPLWYKPRPFLEGQIQSEFTRPEERAFHRFEVTGIGGVRFQLTPKWMLKVGLNARNEVLDPDGTPSVGLNVGYTLAKTEFARWEGLSFKAESNLEYFFNDIGATNLQELRNQNRLFVTLTKQLSLTLTFNAYGFRSQDVGAWGSNREFMMGLHHEWRGDHQSGL